MGQKIWIFSEEFGTIHCPSVKSNFVRLGLTDNILKLYHFTDLTKL